MNDNNNQTTIPKMFIIYWTGQIISLFGSEITQFAIIWWILVTYNSPLYFGLGLIASAISRVAVLPIIGVISDYWNRKVILIVADLLQSVVTLALIICFYFGLVSFELLFLLLTFRGFFQTLHENADTAIIPQLVNKNTFSKLNAMGWFSQGLSSFGGPVTGALLVEIFGKDHIASVLWIDIITFGIALIAVWWIKIPNTSRLTLKPSFLSNVAFGFGYIKQRRILQLLVLMTLVFNFTLTSTHIIMPIYVLSPTQFNAGSKELSLAIGSQSLGVIVSSIYISSRPIKNKYALRMVLSMCSDAIAILFVDLSLVTHNLLLLYIAQFVTGISISYYSIVGLTLWQHLVPNEMLGRVSATRRVFSIGSYPLSLLLTSFLAEIIYPILIVFIGSILCILFLIYVWVFTSFSDLENRITTSLTVDE